MRESTSAPDSVHGTFPDGFLFFACLFFLMLDTGANADCMLNERGNANFRLSTDIERHECARNMRG